LALEARLARNAARRTRHGQAALAGYEFGTVFTGHGTDSAQCFAGGGDLGFALLFGAQFGQVKLSVSEVHGVTTASTAATAAARLVSHTLRAVRSAAHLPNTSASDICRSGLSWSGGQTLRLSGGSSGLT